VYVIGNEKANKQVTRVLVWHVHQHFGDVRQRIRHSDGNIYGTWHIFGVRRRHKYLLHVWLPEVGNAHFLV